MSSPNLVDWDLAARTAKRLVRPGPVVTSQEAAAAVANLVQLSDEAEAHVRALTRLTPLTDRQPAVRVVDRAAWIDTNAAGMAGLINPLADQLTAQRAGKGGAGAAISTAIGSKVTGAQTGAVLGFVASRVLGQYEFFGSGGELLLVAPNIVEAERKLGADPRDFRLWVCLHEATHRLQFTAVGWLEGYLREQIEAFIAATDTSPEAVREQLNDLLRSVLSAMKSATNPAGDDGDDGADQGMLALIKDPAQRAVLDRMTALMSLVEGHAEYVMDEVGPEVVPSVASIRKRFNQRRKGRGVLDRFLRKILGLEAKMKQYSDGRHFVSGVVDAVGIDGFNAVWTSPDTLPTLTELADPTAWVARVHGPRPALAG